MRSEHLGLAVRCHAFLSLPGTGRGDHAKRGGWGPLGPESYEDRIDNTGKIAVDLGVPETQNGDAEPGECLVARSIMRGAVVESMPAAVDLNRDTVLQTGEVENVSLAGNLPPEVITLRAQRAKVDPKLHFLRRHGLSKPARLLVRHETPPTALRAVPPPRAGEGLERVIAAPASERQFGGGDAL